MTYIEKKDNLFWKKKEYVSFILSILVFFIHSFFAEDSTGNSLISIINQKTAFFFCRSITQFAVPMFFILSGITFFKGYNNNNYLRKIKSRLFSLIIPYLLWNTVWMIWEILCSYSFLANFSQVAEPYPLTFVSIFKGIFFYGCYGPFWFIFDIIVFALAAPLIFSLIRNKYVGTILIVCMSLLSLWGIHLPTSLFYYPTAIIFYMIGGMIGYHYFDFISQKSSNPVQIASVVLLVAYILAKNIIPQQMHIDNNLTEIITFSLCSFSLWNIVDIFIEKIKPRKIYRRSFAIYAMHLNIALIILKILSICLPQSEWLKIPKFMIMIILTLTVINIVCDLLEKFLPKIYALFMGNRIMNKENINTRS